MSTGTQVLTPATDHSGAVVIAIGSGRDEVAAMRLCRISSDRTEHKCIEMSQPQHEPCLAVITQADPLSMIQCMSSLKVHDMHTW